MPISIHSPNAGIIGTGRAVPDAIVRNDDLTGIIDTNDEWIFSRTGIKQRRITQSQNTSYYAAKAALKALKASGVNALELDAIIVATCTPDALIPSTACIVQQQIGASNAFAFDINVACSGFIYGLSIGSKMIRCGDYHNVLVVGAEVTSKMLNWQDRATCILFGDGAGAAILSDVDYQGIGKEEIHADGSMGYALTMGDIPPDNPWHDSDAPFMKKLEMDGKDIWNFAVRKIPATIESVLDKSNLTLADIKFIIPHQANTRIIDTIAKRMKAPRDLFFTNMDRYSNTSAASIPIALDELNESGRLQKGDKIILCGFGGGLTWGSIVIEW